MASSTAEMRQIALHYERAGKIDQAVVYYRQAAAHARQLYANEVAIVNFQRALTLLGQRPDPQVADLHDQVREVLPFTGRYQEAREAWQKALDLTLDTNKLVRAELHRKIGNGWRDQYRYEEAMLGYDAAEASLGDLAMDDDDGLWHCWQQIQLERLNALYWLGQASQMLALIDQIRPFFDLKAAAVQQARLHQITGITLLRANRYSRHGSVRFGNVSSR